MKILLNVSTATKGGALHLSTALVREAVHDPDSAQWCIVVSDVVKREIEHLLPDCTARFEVIAPSPARSYRSRRRLARLEADFQPDCVFTPYGPAYVRFSAPHLVGVAVPWIVQPSWLAYRTLDFPHEWIWMFCYAKYREIWFRRASAWWTETESAKHGLVKHLGLPRDKIEVVPNTCGAQYRQRTSRRPYPDLNRGIRLLYFTAPYKHKNLGMVPRVAEAIARRDRNLRFEMVTTLPARHVVYRRMMRSARALGVSDLIDNRGPIRIAEGPALYQQCDICFMPTLLEVFSATYPEAMAMGLPIVTSDLPFARDICGEAALYFEPNNPEAAADCVFRLLSDPSLWNKLVDQGKRALECLPTPRGKYRIYMQLLSRLVRQCAAT